MSTQMPGFMGTVTHFGATVLLVPFALLIAVWLAWRVGRRPALLWCACLAGVAAAVAIGKILLSACAAAVFDVVSPSGHSAAAAIVYGGFTVIAMGRSRSLRSILFRIAIAAWVLLIGVSRVAIGAHTAGDVLAGLMIGALGVAIFAHGYRGELRPPYVLAGGVLGLVAAVALLMPSQGFTLEPWFHWLAAQLRPYQALLCL